MELLYEIVQIHRTYNVCSYAVNIYILLFLHVICYNSYEYIEIKSEISFHLL